MCAVASPRVHCHCTASAAVAAVGEILQSGMGTVHPAEAGTHRCAASPDTGSCR